MNGEISTRRRSFSSFPRKRGSGDPRTASVALEPRLRGGDDNPLPTLTQAQFAVGDR